MILTHILLQRTYLFQCLLFPQFRFLPSNIDLFIFLYFLELELKKRIFTLTLNAADDHAHRAVVSCSIAAFDLRHACVESYSLAVFNCGHEVVFGLWSLWVTWVIHLRILVVSLVSLIGVDRALAFDQAWLCQIQVQR